MQTAFNVPNAHIIFFLNQPTKIKTGLYAACIAVFSESVSFLVRSELGEIGIHAGLAEPYSKFVEFFERRKWINSTLLCIARTLGKT
jgi:hypothetical protein